MGLTPDLLGAAGVGIVLILAGIGRYLQGRAIKPDVNPIVAGIGLGYIEREQMERMITQIERIADAITDKNTAGINDRIEAQSKHIQELVKLLGDRDRESIPRRRT